MAIGDDLGIHPLSHKRAQLYVRLIVVGGMPRLVPRGVAVWDESAESGGLGSWRGGNELLAQVLEYTNARLTYRKT